MTVSVIPADIQPVFSNGCTNILICFAVHGTVNKEKKRGFLIGAPFL